MLDLAIQIAQTHYERYKATYPYASEMVTKIIEDCGVTIDVPCAAAILPACYGMMMAVLSLLLILIFRKPEDYLFLPTSWDTF
ncbi:hypothetical protein SATMO3_29150 [Sporomusa aerivorans]